MFHPHAWLNLQITSTISKINKITFTEPDDGEISWTTEID